MLTTAYAKREITLILALGVAATALLAYYLGLWALLPAIAALTLLAFYRDPVRRSPPDQDVILAPADGKVVNIARQAPGPDGNGRVLQIMVFLRVYDVHINRSPCAGHVTDVAYRPGEFINAMRAEADTRNECNTVTIQPQPPFPGPVRVRQIAGVLARRIVCTARAGDHVASGQRFGMIKLGSRTEVTLPESPEWEVLVRVGQKVAAGRTILARWQPAAKTDRAEK